ncbi:MAG: hypothetical protein AAF849_06530 [Bacteroidota bacterium]
MQDSLGYLWIGSEEGLFRFDGKTFEDRSSDFKSRHIHTFSNSYFVNDAGLYQIRSNEVKLILAASLEQTDSTLFYPNAVLKSKEGAIWIGESSHRIVRYQNGKLTRFELSKTSKATNIQLQADKWGNIWALSAADGLYVFDKEKQHFLLQKGFENACSFLVAGADLLLGSQDLYWFRLDKNANLRRLKKWKTDATKVSAIAQDKAGQFLLGIKDQGLFSLADKEAKLEKIFGANDSHRLEELEFGDIFDIYVSADSISERGAIWVASSNGLWLLQKKYFESIEALPKTAAKSISFGRRDEAWVSFGDLYQTQRKSGQFVVNDFQWNEQINTVLADDNELWLTTSEKKIAYFRNESLQRSYDLSDRGEGVFSLFKDQKSNVWFCQAPSSTPIIGLGKIQADGEMIFYESAAGFESRILVIAESPRGEIYAAGIGATTYLYRYDEVSDRFENISLSPNFKLSRNFEVHDIAVDERGVIWMASTDGLLTYDGENVRKIKAGSVQNGEVRAVCVGERGSIWAATSTKGLLYYDYLKDRYVTFGEASGLPSLINAYRCLKRDAANRIWVCTGEGVVYSNPSELTPHISIAPKIQSIQINKKTLDLHTKPIKIYENTPLNVQFNALAFPGDKIQYQYRLVPIEENTFVEQNDFWKAASKENDLMLNVEIIGTYLLQIRAKQNGGYQWSPINSKVLEVQQIWYKKWWVIVAAIALVLFLFGSSIRLFLLQRIRALERLLSRREKELAAKEVVIQAQYETLDDQQEELEEAMSNIATLHLITSKIHPNSSWEDIIAAIGKAIEQSIGIEAFELVFLNGDVLSYNGYSNQEKDNLTTRKGKYDPKRSLTAYALANSKDLTINDFEEEHTKYVRKKASYRFQSMLFIPFELLNQQKAVFCAYHTQKSQFEKRDILMLKVLVDYLRLSTDSYSA